MLIDRLESEEDEEDRNYKTEVIETHLIEKRIIQINYYLLNYSYWLNFVEKTPKFPFP
jgi:hypothetical protein